MDKVTWIFQGHIFMNLIHTPLGQHKGNHVTGQFRSFSLSLPSSFYYPAQHGLPVTGLVNK